MGVGGQRYAPPIFSRKREPVPIAQEGVWAPGPVWTGAENLVPTGFQSMEFLFLFWYGKYLVWSVIRSVTGLYCCTNADKIIIFRISYLLVSCYLN